MPHIDAPALLVGLGNPGEQYKLNRHNAGALALDAVVQRRRLPKLTPKLRGLLSSGTVNNFRIFAYRPLSYMNNSGPHVAHAASFLKIPAENIIVLHDEIDLLAGKIRVRTTGGLAGHNGLRSLAQHLPNTFRRVRIGVGRPNHKSAVLSHVLGDFSTDELNNLFSPLFHSIADHIHLLLQQQNDAFANAVQHNLLT